MTDFEALLSTLDRNRFEYIVVGGAAAIAHGSARFTQDLDVVYSRSPENLDRLLSEIPGGGTYADLVHSSVELRLRETVG